jgi:glycosyltransferase involved in cell wall biosynthesis
MKIKKEISEKVLTISVSRKEKGGITSFVNTLSGLYETFNYAASTRSKNPAVMLWYFGTCILKLFWFIFIKRIKIVHLHGACYGSFVRKAIIINICRLLKVKSVYHIHSGEFKLFYVKYNKRNIIKRVIDKADVLIVLSDSWNRFFSSIISEKKICILNNMIEKPDFVKHYLPNRLITQFLFLGKIGEYKGIFDLLEVIKENKEYLVDKFVLYVGGDGKTAKLNKFIEKNALQDLVKFEGWVSGEKKKELLASCDVYILPSYNEGLPISILEAMSYGMPIISTNVGGIPEIVTNENGFLIEAGNKQQMLECISYFFTHLQDMEKMGRKSSEISANFYPENVIPKLNSIYEELLS